MWAPFLVAVQEAIGGVQDGREYICMPTLDTEAPSGERLSAVLQSIEECN